MKRKRKAHKGLIIVLSVILLAGVLMIAAACLPQAIAGGAAFDFGTLGLNRGYAVFSLVILAPWAFVGFEATAFDTAHFRFPGGKTKKILILALIAAAFPYTAMAALIVPGVFTVDAVRPWIGLVGAVAAAVPAWFKTPVMVSMLAAIAAEFVLYLCV